MKPKSQYQERDHLVVDYEQFELKEFPYLLRGPKPSLDKNYISILGAGQSFGVLVRNPYAHMIRRQFDMDVFNLSVGGSAPSLYLKNKTSIDICNKSSACIIQVLSARSSDNTYFETQGGKNMLRPRGSKLPFVPGDTAFNMMFEMEPEIVSKLVISEIRANWVREMQEILQKITVPKILLWISKRKPDHIGESYKSYSAASGVFPQFVTRSMIDQIKSAADEYVEVVSSRGVPNKLTHKDTGVPVKVLLGDRKMPKGEDHYYPSPEMHEDTFAALQAPLKSLLSKKEKQL